MKYDEFIKHVQTIGQLDSKQAAEQATRATWETIEQTKAVFTVLNQAVTPG